MAATRATLALERAGVPHRVHSYDPPGDEHPSYGEAVAAVLEVDRDQVFKTLVAEVDGEAVVGIVPVTGNLNLKALAKVRGSKKAVMADPRDAERLTGYVVGGISPFGQRRRLPMVADASIERHDTVFVSGGRRGVQVEVAPGDLLRLTGARVAEIAG